MEKLLAQRTEPGCDYLNELPDDILVEILSKLTVKEAARTCIVSRRCRNICTSSTTYVVSMFCRNFIRCDEYKSGAGAVVVRYRQHFTTLDSAILVSDKAQDSDSDLQDHSRLNKWIQTTFYKDIPSSDVPTLNVLGLSTLNAIYLKSVNTTSVDFENLLASCPYLETLSMENLHQLRTADVRIYQGNEIKLKHLEIRYCKNLKRLRIYCAPNLESLRLARKENTLKIYGRFPKLSSISLEGTFSIPTNTIRRCARLINLVEQLELNMDLIRGLSRVPSPQFPTFINVRTMKLIFDFSKEDSLMNLVLFIEACPRLQKLTLVYGHFRREKVDGNPYPNYSHYNERLMKTYTHRCLQVVEFLGWCGYEDEVRFANFVIRNAINLEDIVFDPSIPQHVDRSGFLTFDQSPRDEASVKKAMASASAVYEEFKVIKLSPSFQVYCGIL